MRKLVLSLAFMAAFGSVNAQSVTFTSDKPEAGKVLSLVYDPAGGKLAKLANVKCVAFTFVNTKQKVVDVPLVKVGETYKGSFTPVDSTAIAVFAFSADGTKDDNPNGYYTLFYEGGKPTGMAYYWEAQFYNGMGSAFVGVATDKAKAIQAYEKAFVIDPSIKTKFITNYLSLQYSIDKVKGLQLINESIASIKKLEKSEENMLKIASLYNVMRAKSSADSVYALVKTNFPKGNYAFGQAANAIYAEKDAVKKEQLFEALVKNFGLDATKKSDLIKIERFYPVLAGGFSEVKNNAKFEEYANKISDKTMLAQVLNSYAWASAEKKENLEFAAKISKRSLELTESTKNDPTPDYFASRDEYLKIVESNYAMFADTYAVLLDHMGNATEALKYQEYAVTKNDFSNPEMNERYVHFLAKAGQKDKVVTYAERFIKDGKGTDQLKSDLKSTYQGSQPFETYYASLEKDALEKEKAKFVKEMINTPAPKFTLANLKGEIVSLAALKGKVVIVDYWATWCGPCIASFPGMQKAVDKYKNDPNVVFLFVNTWQTEANREKLVKDWAAANPNYKFNILLDTKNPKDESKFEVIEQYKVEGIPTKFIVDGNGNIRFKKVGFSGSADGTVKELDMMIALAKGSNAAGK